MRKRLGDTPGWTVSSAGTHAMNGSPASDAAIQALADIGIDGANHRSRQLTRELLDKADLVAVMTRGHRDEILSQWPDVSGKVALITSFGVEPTADDIPDPIGQSVTVYGHVRDRLDSAISDMILHLMDQGELQPHSPGKGTK